MAKLLVPKHQQTRRRPKKTQSSFPRDRPFKYANPKSGSNSSVSSLRGETIPRSFKLLDNISSIKGLAIDRVKDRLGENALIDFEKIAVTQDDRKLNDNQMLVDFAYPEYKTLTVNYPEDEMIFRQRRASVELEEDVFALFEEE